MALKIRKSKVARPIPECAIDACMELLGGAWTPSIVWNLSGGPRRFGELRNDIPGISPKMLSTRLKDMEDNGVVVRTILASSPPSAEYSLSPLGHELLPAINEIARIGHNLKLQRQAMVDAEVTSSSLPSEIEEFSQALIAS